MEKVVRAKKRTKKRICAGELVDKMNNSSLANPDDSTRLEVILMGVILILISLISTAGNLLVLCAIYSNSSLRTMADYLLANLAVADFLQASVAMPLRLVDLFELKPSSKPVISCSVVIFFTILLGGASNINVLLVSVDRLIAIRWPFKYYGVVTLNRVLILIGLCWGFLLTFALLPLVGWGKRPSPPPSLACRFTDTLEREYIITTYVPIHGLCLLAILLIYAVILKAACRHSRAIAAQEFCMQRNAPLAEQSDCAQSTATKHSSISLKNPRRTRHTTANSPRQSRAVRTVAIMVGLFIVLVLPIIVIDVIELWAGPVAPPTLVNIAICMIYANSGVNVFIYAGSNDEYRRTFKRLLGTLWSGLTPSCWQLH